MPIFLYIYEHCINSNAQWLRLQNRWHFLLKAVVAFMLTGNAATDNLDESINMNNKEKKIKV